MELTYMLFFNSIPVYTHLNSNYCVHFFVASYILDKLLNTILLLTTSGHIWKMDLDSQYQFEYTSTFSGSNATGQECTRSYNLPLGHTLINDNYGYIWHGETPHCSSYSGNWDTSWLDKDYSNISILSDAI